MTYRKKAERQYFRKPRGWVMGYTRKGRYHIIGTGPYVSRCVPKSAESIDLVVPIEKDMDIPIGCKFKRIGRENRLIVKVPRESIDRFEVEGLNTEEFLRPPIPRRSKPRVASEYDEQIGVVRKALKKLCPTLSVKRGRGTAYGWIDMSGSGEFGNFTDEEKKALDRFGLNYGSNFAVISPEDRKYYVKRAEEFLRV